MGGVEGLEELPPAHANNIAHSAATISQSATWLLRLPRQAGALV
jgi:hypothetical protein